jgi:hypothetical protein
MPGSGTVFTLVVSAILAVLSCSREATAASVRFTLDLRGINESAQADFQQAVEAGFAGVRHRVVAGELAEYAVRGAIRKEGSVYTFELAVVGVRDETILGERKGRCGPCTQEEALKKVRMAGKFLELAGLDVPAPSVLLPSDGPAVSTAAAAEADPGGGQSLGTSAGRAGAPESAGHRLATRESSWAPLLPWAGWLSAIGVLGAGAILVTRELDETRCGPSAAGRAACEPRPAVLMGGALLAGALAAISTGASIALRLNERDPLSAGAIARTRQVVAIADMLTGTGLMAAGGYLAYERGWGSQPKRILGYAGAGLGALTFITGTAYLLGSGGPERPSGLSMLIGPGLAGVAGGF